MERRVNLCVFPPVQMVAVKVQPNPFSQLKNLLFEVYYRLIYPVIKYLCIVYLEVCKGWVDEEFIPCRVRCKSHIARELHNVDIG